MTDQWELAHGLNPGSPSDALEDSDQDGASNVEEFRAGTDPRDGQSAFVILSLQRQASDARLRFHAVAGRPYTVEFQTEGQAWQTVTNLDADAETGPREALVPAPAERGFYRISNP